MSADDGAVAANFDRTAVDYDEVVRHNIHGANRLVSSIPDGDYHDLLDVGCGTGHASLAMVERFGIEPLVTPTESPWQAAMVERHGQVLGDIASIAIREMDAVGFAEVERQLRGR